VEIDRGSDGRLGDRQTVLAHFSMRGANWPDRVAAAARAGFTGVGLFVGEYVRLTQAGWTDATMQAVLDNHGMTVIELEAMRFFHDDFDVFDHVVPTFKPQRMQVVPPFDGPCDRAAAAAWLRAVAARYAPYGVRLAIEYLGCSAINDARAAGELIDMSGDPSIGLCVDSWHTFRGTGLDGLQGLDPARVAAIQIDDGPTQPVLDDYIQDCLHYRCPLGDGEFDLTSFLRMLPADAPLSVEVIDDDLDMLPAVDVGEILYRSLERTLATV
jgi:sugar phosphate isomerase/epimerase